MIKPPLKKTKKSHSTLILLLILMTVSYFTTACIIFPKFEDDTIKSSILTCFGLGMFFMMLSWLMDPGFLKPEKDFIFMSLLEQFEPNCLCPDCEVIRTPRSRHCNICKRCVDRFDHHCPWINNCVGVKNHHVFYAFLMFTLAYLIQSCWISVYCNIRLALFVLDLQNGYPKREVSSSQSSNFTLTDGDSIHTPVSFPNCCPFDIYDLESPTREYLSHTI